VRVGEGGRSLEWPGELDFCADALWFNRIPKTRRTNRSGQIQRPRTPPLDISGRRAEKRSAFRRQTRLPVRALSLAVTAWEQNCVLRKATAGRDYVDPKHNCRDAIEQKRRNALRFSALRLLRLSHAATCCRNQEISVRREDRQGVESASLLQ
jgi:hypothetical protein